MTQTFEDLFPRGDCASDASPHGFSGGKVWNHMFTPFHSDYNCPVGYVTYSPGSRNCWHTHPGGQVLLITGGRGWYQEEGKPARELHAGDYVIVPPGVKHWHGAAKDSYFAHIGIITNPQEGLSEGCDPVTDEEYSQLP